MLGIWARDSCLIDLEVSRGCCGVPVRYDCQSPDTGSEPVHKLRVLNDPGRFSHKEYMYMVWEQDDPIDHDVLHHETDLGSLHHKEELAQPKMCLRGSSTVALISIFCNYTSNQKPA